ncbi:UNVERIFIED_CONTAM: hypothetical protein GTU68_047002 [Idotea baltica]|nr:hypothetical protein [Idotea baltica]
MQKVLVEIFNLEMA